MNKVLFVCTGNTCRSPMAEAIFKSFSLGAETKSAGLFADGSEYCPHSVTALSEIGIDISGGVSKLLSLEDLTADRIFCMSDSHKQMLLTLGCDEGKIEVLSVADPFGGTLDDYRHCRDEIREKLAPFCITVRPFEEDDASAVAEIEKECFSVPWSEKALLDSHRANTVFFVAETPKKIVGYAGLQHAADEGYVTNIAVLPDYRRLGLGTALTTALIDFAKDNFLSFVSLEVRESNQTAIRVYNALGFETAGLRKNFYDAPREDAVIMTKVIDCENSGH